MRVISSIVYCCALGVASGCVADPTDPGGGGGGDGFQAIKMPPGKEAINFSGVYCTSPTQCVVTVSTNDFAGVYPVSATALGDVIVDGKYPGALPTAAGVLGDVPFVGFDKTRNGIVARAGAAGVFVSATGDITQKSSWTFTPMGKADGASLALNDQAQIQVDATGKWLFLTELGVVYGSASAPSATTVWTKLWSPQSTPTVPANFNTQFTADPTLCDSDVTAGAVPFISNPAFISQDGGIIMHPADGIMQRGTTKAGVCISTDHGQHFYSVAFADVPAANNAGPHGLTCTDNNHCFAIHGLDFVSDPYIYTTSNAALAKTSTWTKATLPASITAASGVSLRAIFFAPDGMHGWCVGDINHKALMLRTTDAGKTWADVSASVATVASSDIYNGFAIDNDHIWIVGRSGTLAFTATAQK